MITDASFLRNIKEDVLSQWETISRASFPAASDKSRSAVRDHLPQLMDFLCDVLEEQIHDQPRELSRTHGKQRFAFGDYTLTQVMGEYSILKRIIYLKVDMQNDVSSKQFDIIDRFFDSASAIAATEFARLREAELLKTAEALVKTNRDLERFTAIAAHDLKSPLATMVSYVDMLKRVSMPPEKRIDVLNKVESIGMRSLTLVDHILDYSRLGHDQIHFIQVNLSKLINQVCENLEQDIKLSGAKVYVTGEQVFEADPNLMIQLLQNLLSNSIKYRHPERDPHIHVMGEILENSIVIQIVDNGLGFDPSYSEEIFEPFKRAHDDRKIKGSGIGLATCQRIVELHNGKIWAESKENEGSIFYIKLPRLSEYKTPLEI